MKTFRHLSSAALLIAGLGSLSTQPVTAQCVSLTTSGVAVSEDFSTLANSGTSSTTPTGWFFAEAGTNANATYNTGTGSSNTGDTYSFGAAAATERAFGGLLSGSLTPTIGACFTNNTGTTVTSLGVAYTGEMWRLGTASRTDRLDFQYSLDASSLTTGTWTDVDALDFSTPDSTGTAGARDGNAAGFRTAISNTIAALSIANGATVWIRWTDFNASGADDGLAVDDFSLTPNGGGPVTPNLTINDVSLAEGNAGTTTFTFTVGLSSPAGAGGVTFDIATADNTAVAPGDYTASSLTGQTIAAGNSTYTFNVAVNGDSTPEANETFFVNVTNVTGANVTDGQGQGTIQNDDVAISLIHDVQGPGASSPVVGATVTVRGIVTGVKSNGFFVQEEEADYDADAATSEGVLVFTSSAPPAAAAVGNLVQVTGTVSEFVPSADPLQPPLTELTSPTVALVSSGNPLPAAIPLTMTFPDPAGAFDQLERVEGMRVSASSLTVTGPTLGSVNEPNATATSTGVFYGVITGVPRPFREAGIEAPDPAPAGTIPPIPRFDTNPERIRVDSDGLVGGPLLDVSTSAIVTGLIGPLDYSFRTYTILPDPASPLSVSGGHTAAAAALPASDEVTVASYNLERFFDTVNDPAIGEPVLTATAFNNRLAKASLGIRNYLHFPDILGIVECENLSTLQALATRISTDALTASQPDPLYQAFLIEGNDVGGIDVGFLVKTALVTGSTPRVAVGSVTQFGLTTTITNPDTSTELLNDRPPLVLVATVNHASGASFPITVIVNHLRSLNGVDDLSAGPNGWPTVGDRVRNKRLKQAEFLANLVQARQISDPAEHIVLLGDFNAFEVNDGLVDSMSVIAGTPVPDNETAVPGDGVDLINPDFTNLYTTPPPLERYSYVFDGNAQTLDHILINVPLISATLAQREEHARINADFNETARNNATTVDRLSDHDPVLAYFQVAGFQAADLAITKSDSPDPVVAGTNLVYSIDVTNNGPDAASNAAWTDSLPAGTTFVSLASAAGWSCTTPAVGSGGMVSCSLASFAVGTAAFTLTVAVDPAVAPASMLSNTATVTASTSDPVAGNNTATSATTVTAAADLVTVKTDLNDPVAPGSNLSYTIAVTNNGPSVATTVGWSDSLPAATTFVSLAAAPGWSCTTPAVGSGGMVSCSLATLGAAATANFTLVVNLLPATPPATTITNTATATAATSDPSPGNESSTATTTVGTGSASLSLVKTDLQDPVQPGSNLTYQIVATNGGPSAASNATVTDALPAATTFVSLSAPAGWSCTTPAVGANGMVSCSLASFAPGTATFTLTVQVLAATAPGNQITNDATVASATPDPNPGDETGQAVTTVVSPATLSASKTFTGQPAPGEEITYEVVITNLGPAAQADNPGDEMVDVLPAELELIDASATAGTALATVGTNTVTWNGALAANASVTVTIHARVVDTVAVGTLVVNQASVAFDADGNGTNEASAVSDDPAVGGNDDPTAFTVEVGATIDIPTLDNLGLTLLALLLAAGALLRLRRRTA